MVRSILNAPEEGTGSIERQTAHAKALVMLAKVHKVWTCTVPLLRIAHANDIADVSRLPNCWLHAICCFTDAYGPTSLQSSHVQKGTMHLSGHASCTETLVDCRLTCYLQHDVCKSCREAILVFINIKDWSKPFLPK